MKVYSRKNVYRRVGPRCMVSMFASRRFQCYPRNGLDGSTQHNYQNWEKNVKIKGLGKSIVFYGLNRKEMIVSFMTIVHMLLKSCKLYLANINVEEEQKLSKMPMVNFFVDLFLDDLRGLPLECNV